MTTKKQMADMETSILLLEDKIERLEEEHITMKQMMKMQNALIDNLQMMVKMLTSTPQKQQIIHVGGQEGTPSTQPTSFTKETEKANDREEQTINNHKTQKVNSLKHRMSRVF